MGSTSHPYEGGNNDVQDLLNDVVMGVQSEAEEPNAEALKFFKLIDANKTELYPGCTTHSKLSFIIRLFQLKCLGKWSIKSFTLLLELLKEVLPEGCSLPKTYYETNKLISDLGLSYRTIEACRNDCMLFWKTHIHEPKCLICKADRWKDTPTVAATSSKKKPVKVPYKKIWYFPIGPRLQRLYMSSNTATWMRWHEEGRVKDEILRHSGVMVTAGTQSFASTRDRNPIYSDITYYGVIQEIIELDYWVGKKVVLFKCDWVSGGRGLKRDDLGFTLVNFSRRMSDKEPFILASQAQQVFYVADPIDSEWQVVIRTQPRDLCDMTKVEGEDHVDTHLQSQICNMTDVEQENPSDDDNVDWIRTDVQGDLVDAPVELSAPDTNQIPSEMEEDDGDVMDMDAYNY